jgi:DNA end-binding protein Ku
MPPRTSWKGFLKLSLVSVPVRAFTANNTSEEIHLNQLHEACHQRIRYQKVCPEHGEVASDAIVSGYEYSKGQYVVIDPQEVAKLRAESDKAVKIEGFIKADAIEPIYHAGRTYYLLPDGLAGNKPYALLHRGMVDADVVAIAQIVIAGKEQLVLLRPIENVLVLTILHHEAKVKPVDEFSGELGEEEMGPEERALTSTLIDASFLEDFDFKKYKDTYVDNLRKLIQLKVDGQEIVAAPEPEAPKIINLMEALKKSVAEAQAAAAGKGRKMAPSAKTTGAAKKKARRKKSG